jgi:superfamily II DNA/RNA helicase
MKLFKNGKIQVLVATDVAARGIDVNGVDAVINYDVPKEMQSYVHRVGRTGRAQTEGKAFTFVSNDANKNIADIERTIKKKLIEFKIDGIDYDEKNLNSNERNNKNFSFSNNNGNTTRYFINIGSKDVSEKQQLKDFILKNAQLKDEEIIDI